MLFGQFTPQLLLLAIVLDYRVALNEDKNDRHQQYSEDNFKHFNLINFSLIVS